MDLKNAFGEVDQKLLLKVLEYHHIPDVTKLLITEYYKNYAITIGTDTYITDLLIVGKGILQGDCLSPLLFNMVTNTLIKTIDEEWIGCMGYNFCNSLAPRHWFRFADNSAVVMSTEQDSQLLLNLFTKWCKWANLIVRVQKCKSFGIKKNGTLSTQFKLCLRVNKELISPVKMGDNFIYLGKSLSFDMNNVDIKVELVKDMNKYFDIFRSIFIVNLDGDSLAIYNITSTLVTHNLDSVVKEYTKRSFRLPQSINTRHFYLPVKKLGMKFTLPSDTYNLSQLTTRNILKQSKNPEIRDLYKATAPKNIEADTLFHQDKPKNPKDRLVNKTVNKIVDDMKGLKE